MEACSAAKEIRANNWREVIAAFIKMVSEGQQGQEVGRCGDKRAWQRQDCRSTKIALEESTLRGRLLFVPYEAEIMRSGT